MNTRCFLPESSTRVEIITASIIYTDEFFFKKRDLVLFEIPLSSVPQFYLDLLFPSPSYPCPAPNWVLLPEIFINKEFFPGKGLVLRAYGAQVAPEAVDLILGFFHASMNWILQNSSHLR